MQRYSTYTGINSGKDMVKSLQSFIDANVTGWESVWCNVCKRNADYEHNHLFPECPVGLALRLRCALETERFKIRGSYSHYSHCTYAAHYTVANSLNFRAPNVARG
jgi:hypothetical protein